jgi:hypothetical protein
VYPIRSFRRDVDDGVDLLEFSVRSIITASGIKRSQKHLGMIPIFDAASCLEGALVFLEKMSGWGQSSRPDFG